MPQACSLFFRGRLSPSLVYNHLYIKGPKSNAWEIYYRHLRDKAIQIFSDSSNDLTQILQAQFVPTLFPQFRDDFIEKLKASPNPRVAVLFLMEAEKDGEAKQMLESLPRDNPNSFFERILTLTERVEKSKTSAPQVDPTNVSIAYADLANRFGVSSIIEDSPNLVQRILAENNPDFSGLKSVPRKAAGRGGGGGLPGNPTRSHPCFGPPRRR